MRGRGRSAAATGRGALHLRLDGLDDLAENVDELDLRQVQSLDLDVRDDAGLGGATGGRDVWLNETSPVGSSPPNPFGLCDMYGNIYQWIEDCYEPDASKLPTDGSAVKSGRCETRGFRSNSFESNPHTMRSANRAYPYTPNTRGRNYLGFRVAKTLEIKKGN